MRFRLRISLSCGWLLLLLKVVDWLLRLKDERGELLSEKYCNSNPQRSTVCSPCLFVFSSEIEFLITGHSFNQVGLGYSAVHLESEQKNTVQIQCCTVFFS